MLILVVDDEEMIRMLMVEFAKEVGWPAEAVGSGEEALAYLEKVRPDLVISDNDMSGIPGLELFRRMRANPKCDGIPFILMTGGSVTEREVNEAGCNNFLAKPFTLAAFREMVSRVCLASN